MSCSFSLVPDTGSIMSLRISFSTHSSVTTQPLRERTVHEAEKLKLLVTEVRGTKDLRGSEHCTGHRVSQRVFGHRTHVSVLKDKQDLCLIGRLKEI